MSEQPSDTGSLSPGSRLADVVEFFGVQATDDDLRWLLPITSNVPSHQTFPAISDSCTAAARLRRSLRQRSLGAGDRWCRHQRNASHVSRVPLGGQAEITFDVGSAGKRMTQAHARITDAADGRLLMRVLLASGGRQIGIDQDWGQPPDVPEPDEWQRRSVPADAVTSFSTDADIRFGPYRAGDRRILCWARLAGTLASTRQGLIALADTLATGMHLSLGLRWRGASLDNNVRIAGDAESEWVLLEMETGGFHNAVGQGSVRIFSPDGVLLATGSQSFAVARVAALKRPSGCRAG